MLPVVGANNFHQPVLDIANRTVFHLCILHSAGLLLLINILVVNESILKISHTSRSFVCTCSACAMVGRLWETKKEKKNGQSCVDSAKISSADLHWPQYEFLPFKSIQLVKFQSCILIRLEMHLVWPVYLWTQSALCEAVANGFKQRPPKI